MVEDPFDAMQVTGIRAVSSIMDDRGNRFFSLSVADDLSNP